MTRTLVRSLLTVSLIVGVWAATSEACHKKRRAVHTTCVPSYTHAGYATPVVVGHHGHSGAYAAPQAYSGGGYPAQGYTTPTSYGAPAGAYRPTSYGAPTGAYGYPAGVYGGYPSGMPAYPGGSYTPGYGPGFGFGRAGYNPGGLGGPASGLGVRPGMGFGGFGPGR